MNELNLSINFLCTVTVTVTVLLMHDVVNVYASDTRAYVRF